MAQERNRGEHDSRLHGQGGGALSGAGDRRATRDLGSVLDKVATSTPTWSRSTTAGERVGVGGDQDGIHHCQPMDVNMEQGPCDLP